MTRAICTTFHKYTPFGGEYYEPLFDFYMMQMEKYKSEFDKLYLLDSNWGIKKVPEWAEVIQVNIHDRYYDAYRKNLHKIKEDLVLFTDNDFIIYKEDVIARIFRLLKDIVDLDNGGKVEKGNDIVSIYDTIGKTFKELGGKSKFCPYLFASRTETLMKYRDIYWGSNMPEYETLGALTEAMLKDGLKPYEMEEDKSNILIDGSIDGHKSKDLGYYHCRNGSLAAYLLATKKYGDKKTYDDYLKNQPKTETLRLCAWYQIMGGSPFDICSDLAITKEKWDNYIDKFKNYHGLI